MLIFTTSLPSSSSSSPTAHTYCSHLLLINSNLYNNIISCVHNVMCNACCLTRVNNSVLFQAGI